MTVLNIKPVPTQPLTAASAGYGGAVSNGVTWSVTRAVFSNTDTVPHTFSVNCVPTSGSASSSNVIIPTRTLQPGEAYVSPELAGLTMLPGDEIFAQASAASVVNFTMSATQIS